MGYPLKQGQTAQPLVFLMIDSTDHISGKTGLAPTVKLGKNGAAGAAPVGTVSEIDSTNLPGWYKVAGNATDSGTLGPLVLHATASGADPADDRFDVVAYDPQSAASLGLTNLDAAISSRSTFAGGAVASVTNPVTVGTNNDRTGYSLASTGLDAITVTAHTGPASTFPQMVVQLWRRFFKRATEPTTVGASGAQLLTYADDGTTVLTTQAISDNGTTQTLGAAS